MVSPVGAFLAPNIYQFGGQRPAPSDDGAARSQPGTAAVGERGGDAGLEERRVAARRAEFRRSEELRTEDRRVADRRAEDRQGSDPFERNNRPAQGSDDAVLIDIGSRAARQSEERKPLELTSFGTRKPAEGDRGEGADGGARDAALRKLRAYEAERARRFPDSAVQQDPRKAQSALREDVLFFGSLNPIEQSIPEVARALRSSTVVLPLKELAESGKSAGGDRPTAEELKRNPLAELADRLLEELGPESRRRNREASRDVEQALERTAVRLLGIAAEDDDLRKSFSPESLVAIERRTRELDAEGPRKRTDRASLFSVVA
jgi:hypothetical protein